MPIVYVHGVATRDTAVDPTIIGLMKGYLSDVISPGRDVDVVYSYWGDVGAHFAWNGAARPRTPLLGQGGGQARSLSNDAVMAADLAAPLAGIPKTGTAQSGAGREAGRGLVPAGVRSVERNTDEPRLRDLSPDALSDLVATVLSVSPLSVSSLSVSPVTNDQSALIMAVDAVAHDPRIRISLDQAGSRSEEWASFVDALESRLAGPLAGQGGVSTMRRLGDRVLESLDRGSGVPGYVASRVVAEFRAPINDLVSSFIGDVFEYISRRGTVDAMGPIPERFLTALRHATRIAPPGEPIVVISHSMGGQIVYDSVTDFLPNGPDKDLRVDYWCATASQVGLFEELKLFRASSSSYLAGTPVPFPDRRYLGGWWNVWDHNDFLSFTVKGIVSGVDDESFDSGKGLTSAHSGYLVRPSFYRRLADKLARARNGGWGR